MFSLMLFLGLIMVYVGIVAAVIIYMNKNVLRQINTFYDALMGYRPAFRFCEENSYVEFAEAGHVLNQLTDEIQALKIDVYEEQLARQKVELDYLQIQIRPHFYINCLNVIYSMAQVNRTTEIQELALSVTKYLRYIFQKSMEPVSVRAELEFVENYLHVLECMGSIKCECHIMLEDAMREFGIPPLLIQTFVENSIKHNMESETPIRITIAVEEVSMDGKKECRIVIGDTGRGFQENDLADFNAGIFSGGSGYHIGLSNAVARLNLFYHSSAHLKFYNADEGGAIVEILIAM
ncbi:MAG: histidine kinase [Clostridiales bacterium]|nr:histidine kinase [Clostridiales bacterium]